MPTFPRLTVCLGLNRPMYGASGVNGHHPFPSFTGLIPVRGVLTWECEMEDNQCDYSGWIVGGLFVLALVAGIVGAMTI